MELSSASPPAIGCEIARSVLLRTAVEVERVHWRHFIFAVLTAAALTPASKGQGALSGSEAKLTTLRSNTKESDATAIDFEQLRKRDSLNPTETSPVHFHKKPFVALSAATYAAALADMHQTMHYRNDSWWYETDPLAKPIVRLPAPAYYATGLALATGVNWLSWKMGHSRRWHKLAPLPQLLSITGNSIGYRSNCFPTN